MRIILQESKKALTSPVLVVLLLLSTAFNILLIFSYPYSKEELKVANMLTETYGVKITDESLNQLEQDLQVDFTKLETITGQKFDSIYKFLDGLKLDNYSIYSEKEWTFFTQLQVKETYLNMANNIDDTYATIDIKRIAESEIDAYGLSGNAAKTLRDEYDKYSQRFEEMKENKEHKEWFFAGQMYQMHSFFFKTIFKTLVFEALILIVLATALITNFEFENQTHLVTYSTKRGRLLMKDKLVASLLTASSITVILLLVTLVVYFSVFDYSYLWGSSISSAFTWEYEFPNVSWWDLSFIWFLLVVIFLVHICMLLFSAITYGISILVKNSYFVFFIFAIFFTLAYLIQSFIPTSSNLFLIAGYNLSYLVLNTHVLFMANSGLMMFKNYELITVSVWTLLAITLCALSLKVFRKQEIH